MKTLNLIFALTLSVITSLSFASNGGFFLVEQEGENMVMYLSLENLNNISSVSINSNYSINGATENTITNISAEDVANFNQGLAKIQTLGSGFDYANFSLEITAANGDVLSYPMVVLESEAFNYNLAKN